MALESVLIYLAALSLPLWLVIEAAVHGVRRGSAVPVVQLAHRRGTEKKRSSELVLVAES